MTDSEAKRGVQASVLLVGLLTVAAVAACIPVRTQFAVSGGIGFSLVFALIALSLYGAGFQKARTLLRLYSNPEQTMLPSPHELRALTSLVLPVGIVGSLLAALPALASKTVSAAFAPSIVSLVVSVAAYAGLRLCSETVAARHETLTEERARLSRPDDNPDTFLKAHREFMTGLLEQARSQFAAMQQEQNDLSARLLERALMQSGEAMEQRVTAMESHVARTLQAFQDTMPNLFRESAQAAVADVVELANLVREQAGNLAHTVAQVSQNADRQVQMVNQWAERAADWQLRLEQTLTETQAAQRETQTALQQRADQSLGRLEQTFTQAADTTQKAHDLMAQAVNYFGQRVVALEAPIKSLEERITTLQESVKGLNEAMGWVGLPMKSASSAMENLNDSTNTLSRALTAVGLAEQKRLEQTEQATATFTQAMVATITRLNDAVDRLCAILQAAERSPVSRNTP